ncbi:class A beta-lactamase [Kineosporia succinea]|uniref:Beta-lactamase n=1 Tax=Kineosporia succinea TaxID=84632 RepID=A0ABT9NZQ4_9ACTN|nr:class A beta-lactamase [Kineosporia succinea]MDP9825737.1 beta-lactamase class A [Kineosporia succinea]
MNDHRASLTRRSLVGLLGLAGLGLSACGGSSSAGTAAAPTPVTSPSPATTTSTVQADATESPEPGGDPTAGPSEAVSAPDETAEDTTTSSVTDTFAALEKTYDTRLGLYALDTGSGRSLTHHADDRFAMASTFKVLAVGALLKKNGTDGLSKVIRYGRADLVPNSPITQSRTSMSLGDLCAAALRYSDNTASNLVLQQVGGPLGVTRFVRTLGDEVTRLDRTEPALNSVTPGDKRDTSTPRNLGNSYLALLGGEYLDEVSRNQLREWLLGSTTGDNRIRAGVAKGWKVADKTGTANYGTMNDVGLIYPTRNRAPIVLSILTGRDSKNAERHEKLIEEATRAVLKAL